MIKYASNTFLATKITYINEIANLCDAVGADVHAIAKAMGLDGRIGKYFLHPGPGFGGSCLPKDTQGLVGRREHGVGMHIVSAVLEANEIQKRRMVDKIEVGLGDLKGKKIAILGLAFKPETDDMRAAPAVPIIDGLLPRAVVSGPMTRPRWRTLREEPSARGAWRRGAWRYCGDEYDAAIGAEPS